MCLLSPVPFLVAPHSLDTALLPDAALHFGPGPLESHLTSCVRLCRAAPGSSFHYTSAVSQFSWRGPLETTNRQESDPLRQGKGQGTVTFASWTFRLQRARHDSILRSSTLRGDLLQRVQGTLVLSPSNSRDTQPSQGQARPSGDGLHFAWEDLHLSFTQIRQQLGASLYLWWI